MFGVSCVALRIWLSFMQEQIGELKEAAAARVLDCEARLEHLKHETTVSFRCRSREFHGEQCYGAAHTGSCLQK
jgi:hypothetical protein